MTFINLTPHAITICNEDNSVARVFAPSGEIARCSTSTVRVGEVDGIALTRTQFGEVTGLPAAKEGTIYIVSSLVANAVPGRTDCVIPNESVRDDQGRIVGCRSLGFTH